MNIRIKYTAQLKKAVGAGEEIIEVSEGTLIKDLLNTLFQRKREAFVDIVFNAEGVFLDAVLIILNGQQIGFDYSETLVERDEITIMSPIAGG
jgi:MoaD family protein